MTDFLITSISCQIALFLVYKSILENSKMHRFNRIYLVLALVFSLVMPFVSIPVATESVVQVTRQALLVPMAIQPSQNVASENPNDYFEMALWTIYAVGLLLFGIRFARNLLQIFRTIRDNPTEKRDGVTYVLIDSETIPHTFLNYIFVNSDEFRKRCIEAELFTHEVTHATQKHSIDILAVEILNTILWFNPILILFKKAVKLNHEFLADEAVIARHDRISYQELLLSKAHFSTQFALASSFNFSITKKRMIMMTKTVSPFIKAAGTLGATAAFALLFSLFGFEGVAQSPAPPPPPPPSAPRDMGTAKSYYSNTTFHIKNGDGTRETKRFDELSKEQAALLPPPPPRISRNKLSDKQFYLFSESKRYAVWIDGKHVENRELKKYKSSDFVMTQISKVYKNARSKKFAQPNQVSLYTAKGFAQLETATYPQVLEWTFDTKGNSVLDHQEISPENGEEWKKVGDILSTSSEKASFPGGLQKFYEFFNNEFKIPVDHKAKERLILKFTVESDGKISNVETVRASTDALGKEAVRTIKKSPDWTPAKENGKAVKSEFHLPIEVSGN